MEDRIKEISEKYCPNYPKIKEASMHERLWAIESSLSALNAANGELHKMIKLLSEKAGVTIDQVAEIWKKEITDK